MLTHFAAQEDGSSTLDIGDNNKDITLNTRADQHYAFSFKHVYGQMSTQLSGPGLAYDSLHSRLFLLSFLVKDTRRNL